MGKYYMFTAAVHANLTWLAIVGVLTSLVSVYYYLRLIVVMYFRDAAGRESGAATSPRRDIPSLAALIAAALATIILGAYPSPLLEVITSLF